jgi:predicted RNA-binding protein
MCEANAYVAVNGTDRLYMENLDRVEPRSDGVFLLVDIYGNQKTLRGRLVGMNLVDHRVVFEQAPDAQQ